MRLKSPTTRLTVSLVLLVVNLLLIAKLFGLVPDKTETAMNLRKGLAESLALQFSTIAEIGALPAMQSNLRTIVERNDEIRSAAIRSQEGKLLAIAGRHQQFWEMPADGKSTLTDVQVPIYKKGRQWGTVEINFTPLWSFPSFGRFVQSFYGLLIFAAISCLVGFYLILHRALRRLDPTKVIPERVQNAFDVLQEGVLILDKKEQILMANRSLAELLGRDQNDLVGRRGSELGWNECKGRQIKQLPWMRVLRDGLPRRSGALSLATAGGGQINLAVNASMVTNSGGECLGSLVTFDDITKVEEQNYELNHLVEQLQLSQQKIEEKSRELEFLASRDPLTLCFNRRSLDRNLEVLFDEAIMEGKDLSCLMVDIDFFKAVNDNYGHATGDQVIKGMAEALRTCTSDNDLVGRYGGEEFCVVLPGMAAVDAQKVAERVRAMVESKGCGGINITASLGVSSLEFQPSRPEKMVDQADQALYQAKHSGRNQVVVWQEGGFPEQAQKGSTTERETATAPQRERSSTVSPYEQADLRNGLPTRPLFEDRINRELSRAKRNDYLVAVLALGVTPKTDLGERGSEQLLRECGQRLIETLREDVDTVVLLEKTDIQETAPLLERMEFGVLLTDIQKPEHTFWVVKRLLDALAENVLIDGNEITVSSHTGISVFPNDGQVAAELYQKASSNAGIAATLQGNYRYLFADQKMTASAARHQRLRAELLEAIDSDQLELYYQPRVDARSNRIIGHETQIHWHNDRLGLLEAKELITVAEFSGCINQLGDWIMQLACRQLRSWFDDNLQTGSIAVDLSPIQLFQWDLATKVKALLQQFNLTPIQLELNIAESDLSGLVERQHKVLGQLHELGVKINVNNFGSGTLSIAEIRDLPLSCLKISPSFVAAIGKDPVEERQLATFAALADGLNLNLLAPGVERKSQSEQLIRLGCQLQMGYYFAKPEPRAEATQRLQLTK